MKTSLNACELKGSRLEGFAQAFFGVPGPLHELIRQEEAPVSKCELARPISLGSEGSEQVRRFHLRMNPPQGEGRIGLVPSALLV
jgi:hypothetical protein